MAVFAVECSFSVVGHLLTRNARILPQLELMPNSRSILHSKNQTTHSNREAHHHLIESNHQTRHAKLLFQNARSRLPCL